MVYRSFDKVTLDEGFTWWDQTTPATCGYLHQRINGAHECVCPSTQQTCGVCSRNTQQWDTSKTMLRETAHENHSRLRIQVTWSPGSPSHSSPTLYSSRGDTVIIGHVPVWRDVPKSIQHMFIHVHTAISFPESSTRSSKVDQLTMDLAWRAHHSPGCLVNEASLKRPVIHQISFMLEFLGYTECLQPFTLIWVL